MISWVTALAVWIAAGARVGRVLVRPATTVRLAIVVAVTGVAAAVTVAIPEVAVTIDRLPERFSRGERSPAELFEVALWLVFTAGSSVIAAAAWPVTSRKSLRRTAAVVYAIGIVFAGIVFLVSPVAGWAGVAVGTTVVVATGLRNIDWTPLGRGIAIFTSGATIIALLAALRVIGDVFLDDAESVYGPDWLWSAAALLVSLGAVWILVEVWFRARLLIRRVRNLHAVLTERFPEVVQDDQTHTTTVLKASDHVAHIMDAMYLQAGGGGLESNPETPPPGDREGRARAVAEWVLDPMAALPIDTAWIAPPEGVSARRWVGDIARACNEAQ